MKYILIWVAILLLSVIAIPLCYNALFTGNGDMDDGSKIHSTIDVYFASEDKVKSMDTDEYILGVIAAEMPASFEIEALKAQAVAARTYTIEKVLSGSDKSHENGADICTDYTHCQAYITIDEAKKKWGKNASSLLKKCKKAVSDTQNIVALYDSEPIKAVFHAYSPGRTEDATDVWGGSVSYLKSVESPGDLKVPDYASEVRVPLDEFKEKLRKEYNVDFSEKILGKSAKTQGGAVETIEIGNRRLKGTDIRKHFNLKSACFEAVPCEEYILFKVRGYGHGVGMSQYGANYYAKEGYTYDEILKKYYTGIELGYLSDIKE